MINRIRPKPDRGGKESCPGAGNTETVKGPTKNLCRGFSRADNLTSGYLGLYDMIMIHNQIMIPGAPFQGVAPWIPA